MPASSPDLFVDEAEPRAGSLYERTTLDRLSFTLKLRERGFRDTALLRAFELAPRESFAPRRYADLARRDIALPLPCGQTMTAPLALARMLSVAGVDQNCRVLEIGAGSGYATAILAHLGGEVVSVERFRSLALEAEGKLRDFGAAKAQVLHADGLASLGQGVFDRIIVQGNLAAWPQRLIDTLAPGGRMVASLSGKLASLTLSAAGDARQELHGPLDLGPLIEGRAAAL